jgi:hypothetical protein
VTRDQVEGKSKLVVKFNVVFIDASKESRMMVKFRETLKKKYFCDILSEKFVQSGKTIKEAYEEKLTAAPDSMDIQLQLQKQKLKPPRRINRDKPLVVKELPKKNEGLMVPDPNQEAEKKASGTAMNKYMVNIARQINHAHQKNQNLADSSDSDDVLSSSYDSE